MRYVKFTQVISGLVLAFLGACSMGGESPKAKVRLKLPQLQAGLNDAASRLALGDLDHCPVKVKIDIRSSSSAAGFESLLEEPSVFEEMLFSWNRFFGVSGAPSTLVSVEPGQDGELELEVEAGSAFRVNAQAVVALKGVLSRPFSGTPATAANGLFRNGFVSGPLTGDYECDSSPSWESGFFEEMTTTVSPYLATDYAQYTVMGYGVSEEVAALAEGAEASVEVPLVFARAPLAAYNWASMTAVGYLQYSNPGVFSPFLRLKLTDITSRLTSGSESLAVHPLVRDLDTGAVLRGLGESSVFSYTNGSVPPELYLYPLPGPGRYRVVLALKCNLSASTCPVWVVPPSGASINLALASAKTICLSADLDMSQGLPPGFTPESGGYPNLIASSLNGSPWVLYQSGEAVLPEASLSSVMNFESTCEELLGEPLD